MDLSIKKKNIIICTTEYVTSKSYGGLAIFLQKFIKCLTKDYNVHLVITSSINEKKYHKGINIYNIDIDNFFFKVLRKYFITLFYVLQSWLINRKVSEIINKKKIEFVHFSNYQCIGMLYNHDIPTITRLSSLESLWSKKNFFSTKEILEKYTLKKTNIIISPSKFLIKELKESYNLKSYFFPPLIEKIKKKKIKTDKKIILTFGSISPGKGSYTIENNIHNILSINKKIYYYWIGNVDKQYYRSNLDFEKKLKANTSHSKRVSVFSKMERKRLFYFLNKSEIVLLPSERDNSPNAALEALAVGKIIIARKNSGYDDLIKNNYNGYLFNKFKDNEILLIIKKYLNLNKKTKNKIKKNIYLRNKLFNKEKSLNSYKKYLKKII